MTQLSRQGAENSSAGSQARVQPQSRINLPLCLAFHILARVFCALAAKGRWTPSCHGFAPQSPPNATGFAASRSRSVAWRASWARRTIRRTCEKSCILGSMRRCRSQPNSCAASMTSRREFPSGFLFFLSLLLVVKFQGKLLSLSDTTADCMRRKQRNKTQGIRKEKDETRAEIQAMI